MANSIYDGDFLNNFQSYRNKQRLAGGQIDPRVVGSIAEADLNSRYADQKSRRSQDLQEKSINNQYELGKLGLEQNAYNTAQNYALNRKLLSAQKSSANVGNMGSIANILMNGAALGNKMGLWGGQANQSTSGGQSPLYSDYTDYLGPFTDGYQFDTTPIDSVGPLMDDYKFPDTEQEYDWMDMFKGFF